jgi:hypothetical protein
MELFVEVRERDPRDRRPNEVEIVFKRVYSSNHSVSDVQRMSRDDLVKVSKALFGFRQAQTRERLDKWIKTA